jgi:hypothetical protein
MIRFRNLQITCFGNYLMGLFPYGILEFFHGVSGQAHMGVCHRGPKTLYEVTGFCGKIDLG